MITAGITLHSCKILSQYYIHFSSIKFYLYSNTSQQKSSHDTLHIEQVQTLTLYNVIHRDPTIPTMSKHLVTVARKNFLLHNCAVQLNDQCSDSPGPKTTHPHQCSHLLFFFLNAELFERSLKYDQAGEKIQFTLAPLSVNIPHPEAMNLTILPILFWSTVSFATVVCASCRILLHQHYITACTYSMPLCRSKTLSESF